MTKLVNTTEQKLETVSEVDGHPMEIDNLSPASESPQPCTTPEVVTLNILFSRVKAEFGRHWSDTKEDCDEVLTAEELLNGSARDLRRLLKRSKSGFRYIFFGLFVSLSIIIIRVTAHLCGPSNYTRGLVEKWYRARADAFDDPLWIRNIGLQVRPIVFFALCFSPLTMILLMVHYSIARAIGSLKPQNTANTVSTAKEHSAITAFKQRAPKKAEGPAAFFFSPLFSVCLLLIFASGLPAFICFGLYNYFEIDGLLGYPSQEPGFMKTFFIQGLYMMSFGWCVTCLFFRAYFTFPWSFISNEYDIEIDDYAVRKLPCKGWFGDIALWSFPSYGHCLHQLRWNQISEVKIANPSVLAKPLPFKSVWARLIASISQAQKLILDESEFDGEILEIRGANTDEVVDIRLWELSAEERAKLFVAFKKNIPTLQLSPEVQEALVGSDALSDPRYTAIWFDVLTQNMHTRSTDLATGEKLHQGAFTIKEKIDCGGQAAIYLASQVDGTEVVLKEFHLTPHEDPGVTMDSAAAFENESSLLAQLDHHAIVKQQDVFIDSGRVYLVLEKVPGQSLRKVVKERGSLSEAQTIDLAIQMTEILQYLHSQVPEIIHRDFTPDNLMLAPNGHLKLIDFSIAERRKKTTGDCAGKHSYTPPEQFRGEATCASDLYALGATLQFLLTAKDPEPLSQSSPISAGVNVHAELDRIIKHATALEVADRCESADWLKTELTALKQELLKQESPDPEATNTAEAKNPTKKKSKQTRKKAQETVTEPSGTIIKMKQKTKRPVKRTKK